MNNPKSNQGGRVSIRAYLSALVLSAGLAVSGYLLQSGRFIAAWLLMSAVFTICAILGEDETTENGGINHD